MSSTEQFQVPFSKSTLNFSLPHGMRSATVRSLPVASIPDAQQAIISALDSPLGAPPLRHIAKRGQRVCIVFTDITRATPEHLIVPALLAEFNECGIPNEQITLLCGTGMHRPSTSSEKIAKLGEFIAAHYRVIDNEPQDPTAMVDLGTTANGVPVLIHRSVIEADLVIATGIVEPHQYAGYSGGSKTLAIGAAGETTIAHTHGPAFVDHPGTRLGRIDGNPFQEAVSEAARMAGLSFIVNVVLDSEKRVLAAAAGNPQQAFRELVNFARSIYEVPIPQQYDIVIGGVGYPKDSNLYQASRAPTYLYFAPIPVAKPGGFFIIPAKCEEGAGTGVGEARFHEAIRSAPDISTILQQARHSGYPPGQQRAFVLAKVLEHNPIIIVGSDFPQLIADCKMIPAASMDEAFEIAQRNLGKSCEVLLVPDAMHTLPVIQEKFDAY
jgi:nickel-dependent lactate racemase